MSPKPEKNDYPEQRTNTAEWETPESLKSMEMEVGAFLDRENRVRSRAYELYVNRGYAPGFDIDDWLLAETEIDGKNRSQRSSFYFEPRRQAGCTGE
jgi:hypothetical protein